ncbi:hypothetical protein, partial [Thalassospira sp.]|uniref:hypothetical protein n=1 Tax=Thalassospira sp. TaxID=1912094 RepID=UPI002625CD07
MFELENFKNFFSIKLGLSNPSAFPPVNPLIGKAFLGKIHRISILFFREFRMMKLYPRMPKNRTAMRTWLDEAPKLVSRCARFVHCLSHTTCASRS